MTQSMINWKRFVDQISHYQSFVLVSHVRPDCDALGSELGMAHLLRKLGKDVRIINAHRTPPALQFIDPANTIEVLGDNDLEPEDISPDCFLILDTSAWGQLGDMADVIQRSKADRMVLDHHVGEDDLGATMYKDYQAEATGTLVVQAADAFEIPLTRQMATPLFAAIATDTGWFRFPSVNAETYRIIARLMDTGVVPAEMYADLYERDTLAKIKLRGLILSRTATELDGALMHTYVESKDFEALGAVPSDTEDSINMTLAVRGAKAAVIFIGQPRGGFKISLRSRCQMDANEIASHFGGGGHKAAAGAFQEGNLDEIRDKVLAAMIAAMEA
ncbi:NanoRNase/pAp phosphatase [Stieleria bergensis]|uniref:NanoRNase/pAp phosphatase n=1 Tax=Stieleria bergensis TaxID=2528025 RepID=A0A517SQM6_9BACT|nr:NanoRNase/pAp phosphatase [Planctomycetes bacterium SV_7m_r]